MLTAGPAGAAQTAKNLFLPSKLGPLFSLSQQSSADCSQLSFTPLLSVCLSFCPFPSSRPVLIMTPVAYSIWQHVGTEILAMGATQGVEVAWR